jgi:Zn-dependent protease
MSTDFYRADSARVTFREFSWGAQNPLLLPVVMPIAGIIKLFRLSVAGTTDDLPVPQLAPFQVERLPQDMQDRIVGPVGDLLQLGFTTPVYHLLQDPINQTLTALATFIHPSGAIGRVHLRLWQRFEPPRPKLFTEFFSTLSDGTFLWTLSGTPDMLAPSGCDVQRVVKAEAPGLWAAHQQRLSSRSIVPVRSEAALLAALDRHQQLVWNFHTARGVFRPARPNELERAARMPVMPAESPLGMAQSEAPVGEAADGALPDPVLEYSVPQPAPAGARHPAVLREIDALQNKKGSWAGGLWLLVITAILFLLVGRGSWPLQDYLFLIPILLVHESGHYLAMRAFGYKNLKMFFIPFLGAAVTGRHYNIAGWKKVVVSLAGPLPGIFIGIVMGLYGLYHHQTTLVHIATLAVFINGFNLLPLMPLDGGHVMHALVFSRHHLLDVVFRVLTGLLLMAAGLFGGKALLYVGIAMLAGTPLIYRIAKAADELRKEGVRGTSDDGQSIPPELAERIVDKVTATSTKPQSVRVLAQQTLSVFENLNARPPGVLTTLGFIGVHGMSIVFVLAFTVVYFVAQSGVWTSAVQEARRMPPHFAPTAMAAPWHGARFVDAPAADHCTLVATFKRSRDAREALDKLTPTLPDTASATLFGDSLLISLPPTDEAHRTAAFAALGASTDQVFVENKDQGSFLRLHGICRDKSNAEALAREMTECLSFGNGTPGIVAPWHVGAVVSADAYEGFRKARRTVLQIRRTAIGAYADPAIKAVHDKLDTARRAGDKEQVKALSVESTAAFTTAQRRAVESLRGAANIDPQILDAFLAAPATQPMTLYGKVPSAVESRLGMLPRTEVAALASSPTGGYSHQNELFVELDITMPDIVHAAPVLLEWLHSQGVSNLRYDVTGSSIGDEETEIE